MTATLVLPLAAFGLWLCLAASLPRLRTSWRLRLFWLLIAAGVPILGWLTLHWGPTAGIGAFAIGLWLLLRPPSGPVGRQV